MVQTFVILSLTYWIVEDYLNNQYLRQYVNDSFQANGFLFGILGLLLVIGPATGLFLRHRHGRSSVPIDLKTPSPAIRQAEPVAKNQENKKPDTDFHPVVAALKADMADRRTSFGSMLGSANAQPSTGPIPRLEIQKTSTLEQLAPNRQTPLTGPKPGPTGQSLPQQPLQNFRPQPPTAPRADQPGGLLAQRFLPVPRPQQPAGSNVLQSSPPSPSQIPANVTTVITGILPVEKKKDPTAAAEEKPSSSQ